MATTYTSTIEFSVWKQHNCVACTLRYRYLLKRKVTGSGGTPDAASKAAYNAVEKAVANDVDQQPCPNCGLLQPDMIAATRRGQHWLAFWTLMPILLVIGILALPGLQLISFSTASVLTALATAMFLFIHVAFDLPNPNANLGVNKSKAQANERRGNLWIPPDQEPVPTGVNVGNGWSFGHTFGYAVFAASAVAFLVPWAMTAVMGLKTNSAFMPEVVGVGDEAYVYFPNSFSCVAQNWRATGSATVTAIDGVPPPQPMVIPLTSKNDTWPMTMRVKSSEKNTSAKPWANLVFPADANLVGKTLDLRVNLTVTRPAMTAGDRFDEVQDVQTMETKVTLSGAKSGAGYKSAWWVAMLAGFVGTTVAGIVVSLSAGAFKNKANKTDIFVPGDGDSDGEDDEEEDDRPLGRAAPPAGPPDDRLRKPRSDEDY